MNKNNLPPNTPVNGNLDDNSIIETTVKSFICNDPFPINELDKLVNQLNDQSSAAQQRTLAQRILVVFQENDTAWSKVDSIIRSTQYDNTKYYALQILEQAIKKQWKILPREQCDGIKNFIIEIILEITKDIDMMKKQKLYISKLNIVLVKIIKQDWPQHWPTALSDIVNAAKQGEALCQNNLEVLKLLSEEIFTFGEDEMVQSKRRHMEKAFRSEFATVFELCYYVMENSDNEELVSTCLKTLLKFTCWIPPIFFFNTELVDKLTTRLLPYL